MWGVDVMVAATQATSPPARPWYKILYVQVLIAILIGVLAGDFPTSPPTTGSSARRRLHQTDPDGDRAIIFCTVVSGISHIQMPRGSRSVSRRWSFRGRLELCADHRPHHGQSDQISRRLATKPDAAAVANYVDQAAKSIDFVLNIIPDSVVRASRAATSCRCCCSPYCSVFR
jgi:aerobic C4-dicarboxylate transport protein